MITLTLPWPPSLNRYWRHPTSGPLAGRHLISAEGRAYRDQIMARLIEERLHNLRTQARLAVEAKAFPPDNRKRDLDNIFKALGDSLTHGGLWQDDSQIDDLRLIRGPIYRGGKIVMTVRSVEGIAA